MISVNVCMLIAVTWLLITTWCERPEPLLVIGRPMALITPILHLQLKAHARMSGAFKYSSTSAYQGASRFAQQISTTNFTMNKITGA